MAGDAAFGDGGEHAAGCRVDDRQALSAFFGDEKARLLSERRWNCKTDKCRACGTKKEIQDDLLHHALNITRVRGPGWDSVFPCLKIETWGTREFLQDVQCRG